LPKNTATQKIMEQLIDSSGSTDSNYRAACRARSPDEFIAKIGVAVEEADEFAIGNRQSVNCQSTIR
jgi:four helix bundle protein